MRQMRQKNGVLQVRSGRNGWWQNAGGDPVATPEAGAIDRKQAGGEDTVSGGETAATFEDMAEYMIDVYRRRRNSSLYRLVRVITKHLRPYFGGLAVSEITPDRMVVYVKNRLEEGAANTTVIGELAVLKRMFRLGCMRTPPMVERPPLFPETSASESPKRHLSLAEAERILDNLAAPFKDAASLAMWAGMWRAEVLALAWDDVDLDRSTVFIRGKGKRRIVNLSSGAREVLINRLRVRKEGCPLVFHRDGTALSDFSRAWAKACAAAGLTRVRLHDLRHAAVLSSLPWLGRKPR